MPVADSVDTPHGGALCQHPHTSVWWRDPTKHASDAQAVHPILQHVGGEAVAQARWRDWRRGRGLLGVSLELLPTPLGSV